MKYRFRPSRRIFTCGGSSRKDDRGISVFLYWRRGAGFCFARYLFLLLGFCIISSFSLAYAQKTPDFYEYIDSTLEISMDFKDASLKDILKAFSIQSGINFIVSEKIQDRKVTVYLDKVSVKEAMDKLFKANDLIYEFYEEPKIVLVKPKPKAVTITKVFPLNYARVSSSSLQEEMNKVMGSTTKSTTTASAGISSVITKLLSKEGKLIEDPRTNSLIISDIPERFPIIEKTIKDLDVPVPQVMLEVEMLDVSKNLVDKLGFNFSDSSFGESPLTFILPGEFAHSGTRFFLGNLDKRGLKIDGTNAQGSVILGNTYAGLLNFLRTQTDVNYLARPRILTLNNETAEIKIESNELIGLEPELGGDTGTTVTGYETEREKTGISLRVTPQVNIHTGEITMFICPRVAEATLSAVQPTTPLQGQTPYQDIEERGTKSLVKVRDGDTVILGGLIHKEKHQVLRKVPLLGDIPILGLLFRHKDMDKNYERELLVFITPHIVNDGSKQTSKDMVLSSTGQGTPSDEARLLRIDAALDSFNALNATTQTQQ